VICSYYELLCRTDGRTAATLNATICQTAAEQWQVRRSARCWSQVTARPRNRSSRPLTIDLRQILINSIDRLYFWPSSRLSSTQRHGDRLDRLDRLYAKLISM